MENYQKGSTKSQKITKNQKKSEKNEKNIFGQKKCPKSPKWQRGVSTDPQTMF